MAVAMVVAMAMATVAHAQQARVDRLPGKQFDVLAPSGRVEGPPGRMRIARSSCQALPGAMLRKRIVDIAVQEWAFFGFQVVDQTSIVDTETERPPTPRRTPWLTPEESARVADTIAGYWSTTPRGGWILDRQNAVWSGHEGVGALWRDPWSAAFVSWVMCEAGLSDESQFRRAIAHHSYIDQAIEARGNNASRAGFVAFDVGEAPLEPGDLVCSTRRSAFRSISERKRALGNSVRSHCDIVVQVDRANQRILGIGGNVRGAVSLKILPAAFHAGEGALPAAKSVGRGRRAVFAHLKLRADSMEADALSSSATIRALRTQGHAMGWLRRLLPTP